MSDRDQKPTDGPYLIDMIAEALKEREVLAKLREKRPTTQRAEPDDPVLEIVERFTEKANCIEGTNQEVPRVYYYKGDPKDDAIAYYDWETGAISINETRFSKLSPETQEAVIGHEFGHGFVIEAMSPFFSEEDKRMGEYAADRFGAFLVGPEKMKQALTEISIVFKDELKPTFYQRIDNMDSIIIPSEVAACMEKHVKASQLDTEAIHHGVEPSTGIGKIKANFLE